MPKRSINPKCSINLRIFWSSSLFVYATISMIRMRLEALNEFLKLTNLYLNTSSYNLFLNLKTKHCFTEPSDTTKNALLYWRQAVNTLQSFSLFIYLNKQNVPLSRASLFPLVFSLFFIPSFIQLYVNNSIKFCLLLNCLSINNWIIGDK